MARVLGVVVLFTLTMIQMVNANADLCKGLSVFRRCGDRRFCVCANWNINTFYNDGATPCKNLVCRNINCLYFNGIPRKPKKVNGVYVYCSSDDGCGNNFECFYGYCCRPLKKY
ncbi:uncharacterized protein LOC132714881 [Ruditapes philippinarum]|uniref:uncharacterized protein LOC132714881 n=1 Tax=Ruditapes philippinarum TaxID=129788 RepID=UPI00295A7C65|nr:uncharacterized protein LOC132714881 [Ruditapes philippinarum]XP_060553781.1 uncharacterized protein LOC132714881 [Ruditapes philippinarum]